MEDGVAVARDDDVLAVAGGVGIGRHDARQRAAGAFTHHAGHVVFGNQAFHHVEDGLVQGHVHHLALPGLAGLARLAVPAAARGVAVAQRHHGADHAMQRGQRITDGNAHAHGGAVRLAAQVAQAAHGFADGAEAGQVAVRTRLAITGHAQHHQPRIDGAQVFPAQAPAFHRARLEVLDHDVDVLDQRANQVLRLGLAQVQADRFLVARLHLPPDGRAVVDQAPVAQGVALAGRLDLDHLGAEFAQHLGGERPSDQLAQLQHTDPAQWFG
ncbi:hypothetical protein G6F57_014102 [Rhizopus arrhizus]|nr:hypothetical protein G6F57_014102 [Rhizopus arrhizus]